MVLVSTYQQATELGVRTADDDLERLDGPALAVDVVQPRDLDEPAHVMREQLVVHDPARELVPLVRRAPVDADAPFTILSRER